MKQLWKRLTAWLLACVMLVTLLPAQALAAERRTAVRFEDVTADSWFYQPVLDAVEAGIFSGVSSTRFDPLVRMSRAMFVTVLGQLDGVRPADYPGDGDFPDVKAGEWYAPYVVWASRGGIVLGYGDGRFAPDDPITREQMASMLVRWMDAAGIRLSDRTVGRQPGDLASVSGWAREAVLSLWNAGLMQGDSAGNLHPGDYATRAEGASFFLRARETVTAWREQNAGTPAETTQPGQPSGANPGKTPASPGKRPGGGSGSGGGGSSGGGSGSGQVSQKTYEITFNTNGGSALESRTVREGAALGVLPTPYKAGFLFQGWYYDSELTELASAADTASGPLTLYAAYEAAPEVTANNTPYYTTATDVAPGFQIHVVSTDGALTPEQVSRLITAKNLSGDDIAAGFSVTGGNGSYILSGGEGGFEPGFTYRIILNDERLTFSGEESTIREYHFTVDRTDEALGLELEDGIRYIPMSSLSGTTSEELPAVDAPLVRAGGGNAVDAADMTSGSFTYTGSEPLAVGDIVSVYEGIDPRQRKERKGQDGSIDEVSYVRIIGQTGDTYEYTSAEVEDVVVTPDILPVSKSADTDNDLDNHSITVPVSAMTYTDDKYSDLGLDSQTTVDIGDYIAFYSGEIPDSESTEMPVGSYARITAVQEDEGNYIIAYEDASIDDIMAVMDVFTTDPVSGEQLLEGVDVERVERSLERQAEESGFAEEAGAYLAALALETDTVQTLSGGYRLRDYSVGTVYGLAPGQNILPYAAAGGDKVEVETEVKARLGTNLEHFSGMSGVRAVLEVNSEITLHASDENDIVINLTGTFEQEVRVSLNVSGGAVWKWKWIFPYIADYKAAVSVDLYEYTGIGVNATVTTNENEEVENIVKQLQELLESGGDSSVSAALQEKYANMLENESDWVQLFSQPLLEQKFTVALIFTVNLDITFQVTANMNISLGADFWYENAKRYVYNIRLFQGSVTSDTINLVDERYVFEFYVMGTMGLRAGILVEVGVSLITKSVAYVGVSAEAGAYIQLWGFFYYKLEHTAASGTASNMAGAFLLELGVYLEVKFNASALGGRFAYNPTLYENLWPLLSAGSRELVEDFTYPQEEAPQVRMKHGVHRYTLPDSTFRMKGFDLTSGETFESGYNSGSDFTVTIDNPAFRFQPQANEVTVSPGAEDTSLDGTMTITWKGGGLAFTSEPIRRTIPLHWDSIRDGCYIAFQTNGGSAVNPLSGAQGSAITAPADPTRQGYTFSGWYSDEGCTTRYTIPARMPGTDAVAYAGWTPRTDTPYTVEHYRQELNGQYTLAETERLAGTTDSVATPARKGSEGFESPAAQELSVAPDGSAILRYYYPRSSYRVTFRAGALSDQLEDITNLYKYGALLAPYAPIFASDGWTFTDWDHLPEYMPANENLVVTARWEPAEDTPYRVEHYLQTADDTGYVLDYIESLRGTTNTDAAFEKRTYAGYGEGTYTPAKIAARGTTAVKVYYNRNEHTLTYDLNTPTGTTAEFAEGVEATAKWRQGAQVTLLTQEQVLCAGYGLTGWFTDKECTERFDGVMPDADLKVYAGWSAGAVSYNVVHRWENANDKEFSEHETEPLSGLAGTEVTPAVKEYEHFNAPEAQTVTIKADGSTVVTYDYKRKKFPLAWNFGEDGTAPEGYTVGDVKYGASITAPVPTRPGYRFLQKWYLGEDSENPAEPAATMPANPLTYTAQWGAETYTIQFISNGGTGGPAGGDGTYTQDVMYRQTVPTPLDGCKYTYTGYDFAGWNTKEDGSGTPYTVGQDVSGITADLTLYAQWDPVPYNITYDLDGGTNDSGNPATYTVESDTFTLEAPTRDGYKFIGWTGMGITTPDTSVSIPKGSTGDRTYTANWAAIYTITLDSDGNMGLRDTFDGLTQTRELAEDDSISLPSITGLSKWQIAVKNGSSGASPLTEALSPGSYSVSRIADSAEPGDEITLTPVWTNQEGGYNMIYGRSQLSNMNGSSENFKLGANLDMSGGNWTPLGGFAGEFEGDNHTISNLTSTTGGFIATIYNSTPSISNLTFDHADISGDKVGIVVDYVVMGSLELTSVNITNSSVSGSTAGGLIGCAYNNDSPPEVTITGCTVSDTKISSSGPASGFVGAITGVAAQVSGGPPIMGYVKTISLTNCRFLSGNIDGSPEGAFIGSGDPAHSTVKIDGTETENNSGIPNTGW